MNTVAQFSIHYVQYLNQDSQLVHELPLFAQDCKKLQQFYKDMCLINAFDKKAIALQRTGKMGTYPAYFGQEAVGIGSGSALNKDDVFVPHYRNQAELYKRGVSLTDIFAYWGGDERGSNFPNNREDFPLCIPIATQCPQAVGVAFAIKYRNQARAVLTTIGDGGTSKGDFYESINAAGLWQLPLVFVINNNQWAISVPLSRQTHCQTLAQKAIAGGVEGIQVDGNDVIAVYQVVSDALSKARSGGGPTVIEALTYRLCDHTTADDFTRYYDKEAFEQAKQLEPLARLRRYLVANDQWSDSDDENLQQEIKQLIEQAVAEYEAMAPDSPKSLLAYLYATVPTPLQDQYNSIGENQ